MKTTQACLCASLLILGSGTLFAAGRAQLGFVNVTPNSMMNGTMNVRYNTVVAGAPYIGAMFSSFPGTAVSFFGRDDQGETFSCNFWPTNPQYDAARAIAMSISGPTYILVTLKPNSSECDYVSAMPVSYYQN